MARGLPDKCARDTHNVCVCAVWRLPLPGKRLALTVNQLIFIDLLIMLYGCTRTSCRMGRVLSRMVERLCAFPRYASRAGIAQRASAVILNSSVMR